MKVNEEITISNIYWNRGLRDYFFRNQATETLEEFVNACRDSKEAIDTLDEVTAEMSIEDVEELFYSESIDDIARELDVEQLIDWEEYYENNH